jgi:hypothetical protein
MGFSKEFTERFAEVMADANACATTTPLNLALLGDWNKRLLEYAAPDDAGVHRSSAQSASWPNWTGRAWVWVDVPARPLPDALTWLDGMCRHFEDVLPNVIRAGDPVSAVAWPFVAILSARPFCQGNVLTASICLSVMAKKAGLTLTSADWGNKVFLFQIYNAIRLDGRASIKPLAEYIRGILLTDGGVDRVVTGIPDLAKAFSVATHLGVDAEPPDARYTTLIPRGGPVPRFARHSRVIALSHQPEPVEIEYP